MAGSAGGYSFSELVFSDLQCYRPNASGWLKVIAYCTIFPGLIASIILRAQQCLFRAGHRRAATVLRSVGVLAVGCDFTPGMTIGRSLHIPHPVGITMGNTSVIGDNVLIAQGVTVGARFPDAREQPFPVIGDHVVLLAHATVAGGVNVGRHAQVAANSLVLSDVPDYALMMGVPARKIGSTRDETG